jgi:SAM-dependent methyltransferase
MRRLMTTVAEPTDPKTDIPPRGRQSRRPPADARLVSQAGPAEVRCFEFWRNAGATLELTGEGARIGTPPVAWHYSQAVNLDFSGVDFGREHCWVRLTLRDVDGALSVALHDDQANSVAAEAIAPPQTGLYDVHLRAVSPAHAMLLLRTGQGDAAAHATVVGVQVLAADAPEGVFMERSTGAGGEDQNAIDKANAAFWDELCGSHLAEQLDIVDDGPQSLKRFDDWFYDYYFYLPGHLPTETLAGKRVLEVGLGYGTVAQKIAESGADYLGMDIAAGPVAMARHRLRQASLAGDALQRSFLDNGLADASFDAVVSIGCFHHTGDLQRCLDETWRILKPGGMAYIMVYHRYSLHRWRLSWGRFVKELLLETLGLLKTRRGDEVERAGSDRNLDGEAAPETVFVSRGELRRGLRRFAQVSIALENLDDEPAPGWDREKALRRWGPWIGTDLYVAARK